MVIVMDCNFEDVCKSDINQPIISLDQENNNVVVPYSKKISCFISNGQQSWNITPLVIQSETLTFMFKSHLIDEEKINDHNIDIRNYLDFNVFVLRSNNKSQLSDNRVQIEIKCEGIPICENLIQLLLMYNLILSENPDRCAEYLQKQANNKELVNLFSFCKIVRWAGLSNFDVLIQYMLKHFIELQIPFVEIIQVVDIMGPASFELVNNQIKTYNWTLDQTFHYLTEIKNVLQDSSKQTSSYILDFMTQFHCLDRTLKSSLLFSQNTIQNNYITSYPVEPDSSDDLTSFLQKIVKSKTEPFEDSPWIAPFKKQLTINRFLNMHEIFTHLDRMWGDGKSCALFSNPLYEPNHLCIAGGSGLYLMANIPTSDTDIFILAKDFSECKHRAKHILLVIIETYKERRIIWSIFRSIITIFIFIDDTILVFEIILTLKISCQDVIDNFDISPCDIGFQISTQSCNVNWTPHSLKSLFHQKSFKLKETFLPISRIKKMIRKGFDYDASLIDETDKEKYFKNFNIGEEIMINNNDISMENILDRISNQQYQRFHLTKPLSKQNISNHCYDPNLQTSKEEVSKSIEDSILSIDDIHIVSHFERNYVSDQLDFNITNPKNDQMGELIPENLNDQDPTIYTHVHFIPMSEIERMPIGKLRIHLEAGSSFYFHIKDDQKMIIKKTFHEMGNWSTVFTIQVPLIKEFQDNLDMLCRLKTCYPMKADSFKCRFREKHGLKIVLNGEKINSFKDQETLFRNMEEIKNCFIIFNFSKKNEYEKIKSLKRSRTFHNPDEMKSDPNYMHWQLTIQEFRFY